MCFTIFWNKKRLSGLWKREVETVVLVKNWPYFSLFILGNIGQENVFQIILNRQNTFLGYKNKK